MSDIYERQLVKISQLPPAITPITRTEIVEAETADGLSVKIPLTALGGYPDAHADSHKLLGDDPVGTDTPTANAIPVADGAGRLNEWIDDATESAKGKVQLSVDGGTDAGKAVQATDGRLSDSRNPTVHASEHLPDGADPIDLATASNYGLMTPEQVQTLDSLDPTYMPSMDEKAALAGTWGEPSDTNRYVTDTDPRIGGEIDITDVMNWASFNDVKAFTLFDAPAVNAIYDIAVFNGSIYIAAIITSIVPGQSVVYKLVDGAWTIAHGYETFRLYAEETRLLCFGMEIVQIDTSGVFSVLVVSATNWRGCAVDDGTYHLIVEGSNGGYQGIYTTTDFSTLTQIDATSRAYSRIHKIDGYIYTNTTTDIYRCAEGATSYSSYYAPGHTMLSMFVLDGKLVYIHNPAGAVYDVYEIDTETAGRTLLFQNCYEVIRAAAVYDGYELVAGTTNVIKYSVVTNPSINTDVYMPVYLPSTLPIGSRKVIRKLGTDATKAITIYPPSGATIDGDASRVIYSQYGYIEIERVSVTVFTVKDANIEKQGRRLITEVIETTTPSGTSIDKATTYTLPSGASVVSLTGAFRYQANSFVATDRIQLDGTRGAHLILTITNNTLRVASDAGFASQFFNLPMWIRVEYYL